MNWRPIRCILVCWLLALAGCAVSWAQEQPLRWSFSGEVPEGWKLVEGAVFSGDKAPRPPSFPTFPGDNQALDVSKGGYVRIPDEPSLRFGNGETITIEAWVDVPSLRGQSHAYIVGKGRTHREGFPMDNQNWALRLSDGQGYPSFLFATRSDGGGVVYHRWTANRGVHPGTGWHHVVVSYRFGSPDSAVAYVDGEEIDGVWDLEGGTTRPPIQDEDEVWLGGSLGGNRNSGLRGYIDEVVIHRHAFTADELSDRFGHGPPVPPAMFVEDKVRVAIHEGLRDRVWGAPTANDETDSFFWDTFSFDELPQKYVRGLRTDRSNPFLIRAAARVRFPVKEVRLLLRSRSAARLWVDGNLIAENAFKTPDRDGHDPVPPHSKEHVPGLRLLGPGDRETLVTFRGGGRVSEVIFETVIGGARLRQEVGEASLSLSIDGGPFVVVSPSGDGAFPLTDVGWSGFVEQSRKRIELFNRARRRDIPGALADYWGRRHQAAREYIAALPEITIPEAEHSRLVNNAIDRFVVSRIEKHNEEAGGNDAPRVSSDYGEKVAPILRQHCFRCHGDKKKGGLRLSSREHALRGGESGDPAIVPNAPERSELLGRIKSTDPEERMPPKGERLDSRDIELLEAWIRDGAHWEESPTRERIASVAPVVDDDAFRRRVALDTVGRPDFKNPPGESRGEFIDRMLADDGWADHWTSYWQDVLAENPNILKPSLNNTGPFRWWIHESMIDNKPMDRFVTELVMMEGSTYGGGPAGFKLAKQNDVPMAAKAHVIGTAFLGVEMKCARCHDAPFHESKQAQLFQMAAMLERKALQVPESSSVPDGFAAGREPLIEVSLKPGEELDPHWPFEAFSKKPPPGLVQVEVDPRERLAVHVTSYDNDRFAKVLVNRLWRRLIGRGLVEPVDDWEGKEPSHPELLEFLARELVSNGYDLKHVARLILNSQTYQRSVMADAGEAAKALFATGLRRRLSAEQIVDTAFHLAGKPLATEELNFDIDGGRAVTSMLSLGSPRRAWEFTSLSNERDRPALALPRAQFVTDVLTVFGWRSSRPNPLTVREEAPNVLQPAAISNGHLLRRVVGLSDDSAFTELALADVPPDVLVDTIVHRMLGRAPSDSERSVFTTLLSEGYYSRRVEFGTEQGLAPKRLRFVSWSNHLSPEASEIKLEAERRARAGDLPTPRLDPDWRERLEDMIWSLLNSPEFLFVP